MKIAITHIDAVTGVLGTLSPMTNGPTLPKLEGWVYDWSDESNWPVSCVNGVYQTAPKIYGFCNDSADITVNGVIAVLSDDEYAFLKNEEHEKRKPYPSWVGDIDKMSWNPPLEYPMDDKQYQWDEPTVSWVEIVE
jgi:hypothetical protein